MPPEIIIQTHQLCFAYNQLQVLDDINLSVRKGSIFGFLGPNGAGKSTTIKVLLGLLNVKEGMVSLFGRELKNNSSALMKRVGAMVESPSLYDHLSGRHNLEITRRLRGLPGKRISEVLETVGLTDDAHRQVRQYSTGMKQRLSLAISLLPKPDLLILDEPINGLDPSGIMEIRNLLQLLNQEYGCTIFLSSHILDEIEKLCDHVAVIHKGRLLYQGSTSGMMKQYQGTERLLLSTGENKRAMDILARYGPTIEGEQFAVACSTQQEAAGLIRHLVESGIEVYSAIPTRNDLEQSFLEILQKEQPSGGKPLQS